MNCGMNALRNAATWRLFTVALGLLARCSIASAAGSDNPRSAGGLGPSIADYATIEAYVGKDEVPVYAFGYTYVYGVSPDLLPGVVMQEGDTKPVVKFKPKKSWEIQSNLCGLTPTREPKTAWNDDQPLLPIHLIDGDPETAWCSREAALTHGAGVDKGGEAPVWIRIDLPAEATVAAVALICSRNGPSRNPAFKAGKALPKELTIKLSRDAAHWETVYENKNFSGPDSGPSVIEFPPRPAKQIWIIGGNLSQVFWYGPAFSIGEVEVRDPEGNNLAHVARGAGVQVSSTDQGLGENRFTMDMIWPLQYDLGFKWTRVGYDLGMFLWSYVEREKGRLRIDPKADQAITEAWRNGINIILCLDKGNWLYHDPPRKTDWKKARTREMMETYFDHQGWPTDSPEMMAGYLRYVDYMVRHFKGRVAYYEILNEWNHGPTVEEYVKLVRAAVPVIRQVDPEAKIMLGSPSGFDRERLLACLGKESVEPSIAVREGRMMIPGYANRIYTPGGPGYTMLLVDGLKAEDVRVSVDARGSSESGILLRFQDRGRYLLAMYDGKKIYFQEVIDGKNGPPLNPVDAGGLGETIRLSAELHGPEATLTLTEGTTKSVATKHKLAKIMEAGRIGLFHKGVAPQAFDNFEAAGPDGRILFKDGFAAPNGAPQGWEVISINYPKIEVGLASQVDAIAWHPYQHDPEGPEYRHMRRDVEQFKRECQALGFKGQYGVTEWAWYAPWTEIENAKYSAQFMVTNCGLDMISLYNETVRTLRGGFQRDPISPHQPKPVYYALRSLSTTLDGFKAAKFPVTFSDERPFECYTFQRGDNERMLAAWIPGKTSEGIVEIISDVTLPDMAARRSWVVDIMNGTEQELKSISKGNDTVIPGMLIKDYPTFIRIRKYQNKED